MPRTRSAGRAGEIVDAAVDLFMRRGYRATRMEAIADEAGVAPGTLYLYAAGKSALFELALLAAFREPLPDLTRGPHEPAGRSSLIESTWEVVRRRAVFPRLERAAGLPDVADVPAELEGVVTEFHDWLARHWRGVRMIERCALEWPELGAFFYAELRRGGLDLMERYLEGRIREGTLRPVPSVPVAARFVVETVSFFAMHRHTAPDSGDLAGPGTRETVVELVCRGLRP